MSPETRQTFYSAAGDDCRPVTPQISAVDLAAVGVRPEPFHVDSENSTTMACPSVVREGAAPTAPWHHGVVPGRPSQADARLHVERRRG